MKSTKEAPLRPKSEEKLLLAVAKLDRPMKVATTALVEKLVDAAQHSPDKGHAMIPYIEASGNIYPRFYNRYLKDRPPKQSRAA